MLIVVYTLGCKINRIESRSVIAELTALGHETTEDFVPADLYVINTCAVTAEAERKSRQMVSKAARVSPGAKVIILGCSGQNDREAFGRFDNVVFIGGAASKARAVREYIDGAGGASGRFALPEVYEEMRLPARTKTREFVKVQDGCDNFCSYCIVPYLRGSSRSRGLDSIAAELNAVEAKEIVLSGVNLSDYGSNIGAGLTDLLRTAGAATSARIRLGSLEARVITDGLLQTMSEINFCRHFHLSLQSGSAEVLRAMNRKYTPSDFLQKVALIREYFPTAGITTDIICGFPGESEQNHAETLAFVREAGFSDIHIFPYSPRPGTEAAKRAQIPVSVRKRRAAELETVRGRLSEDFRKAVLGTTCETLTEQAANGCVTGYSGNYLKVYLSADKKPDMLYNVKIMEIFQEGVKGEVL